MKMIYRNAQKRLAYCWFIASFIIVLIILMQTLMGKIDDSTEQIWGWAISAVSPTLTLITAVFAANRDVDTDVMVDGFLYRLVLWTSIGYFIILLLHILIEPFTEKTEAQIVESSKLYIGLLQGIVSGCMGIFFVKKEKDKGKEPEAGKGNAAPKTV